MSQTLKFNTCQRMMSICGAGVRVWMEGGCSSIGVELVKTLNGFAVGRGSSLSE